VRANAAAVKSLTREELTEIDRLAPLT